MAKVRDNIVTEGLSGKLGKRLVFRKGRGGKTIVSLVSPEPSERVHSEAQVAQQDAFKQAATYARVAKDQPVYVRLSQGAEATSYNFAVADWLGRPEVLELNTGAWVGERGMLITVRAIDDTKVVNVDIVIHHNGEVLEQGRAVPSGTDGLLWTYITTTDIPATSGLQLDANAYDLAGNVGSSSVTLN